MLSLLTSGLAFVATTTHQIAPTPHHHHVRAVSAPSMGLFDGFKEAFENKVPAADTNAAGKSKKVDGYVKKKMEKTGAYEKERKSNAPSEQQGNRNLDDLFKGWTWK